MCLPFFDDKWLSISTENNTRPIYICPLFTSGLHDENINRKFATKSIVYSVLYNKSVEIIFEQNFQYNPNANFRREDLLMLIM